MANNKIQLSNGDVLIDLTGDSVTPDTLLEGATAHNAAGEPISGTLKIDNSLGLTGATVGQIAKISAVDAEGKPTAWEAVDMPMGGTMQWYKCSDVTTAEELTEYVVSQDEDGVPIEDYNPVAIMLYCSTPADDTQASTSGNPWVYPSATISSNEIRTVGNIANWKKTARVNNYIAFGSAAGISTFGFSAFSNLLDSVVSPPYKMNGIRIRFNVSGDHFPVGTHFMVSVLGVKP